MILLVLLLVLALGPPIAAEPLRVEPHRIERILPGCGDAKSGCVHVRFEYVEAVSGPEAARATINAAVFSFLLKGSRGSHSLGAYADWALKDYRESPKIVPEQRWYLLKSISVLRAEAPVFSLKCVEDSYWGGAHGMAETHYLNFEAETGQPATLSSILKDGSLPRLTRIAEEHFRVARKLAPGADFKQAGFIFFKDDRFQLTDNFGIGRDSLVFFYNPYEVAPYYLGPTEVHIPFEEIRDLLRLPLG